MSNKRYVIISDFNIHSNNRGTAALGYGAITFLLKNGYIEDDCWLGFGCEILSGVHIGRHSIVAARAVVTKNVPPYSVVAGNPAKIVKQYNFDKALWERI